MTFEISQCVVLNSSNIYGKFRKCRYACLNIRLLEVNKTGSHYILFSVYKNEINKSFKMVVCMKMS